MIIISKYESFMALEVVYLCCLTACSSRVLQCSPTKPHTIVSHGIEDIVILAWYTSLITDVVIVTVDSVKYHCSFHGVITISAFKINNSNNLSCVWIKYDEYFQCKVVAVVPILNIAILGKVDKTSV